MGRPSRSRAFPLHLILAAIAVVLAGAACAGQLPSKPAIYTSWRSEVDINGRPLGITFVKPVKPREPAFLVLFATGDAGWMGASGDVFTHMAGEGYYLAAYDSREIVRAVKRSGGHRSIPDAAAAIDALIVRSRDALALPSSAKVVVTGYSRGANFVVVTAGVRALQQHVGGAVAMALTRETDYLEAPPPADRPPQLQVDEKGRIQTYPAIALAGPIPFAVIQSSGDSYVPAEEARQLFGPDTPTRRLYEVAARNHGFSGGKDELLRDLDDALDWIASSARGG